MTFRSLLFLPMALLTLNPLQTPLIQAAPKIQFSIVFTNDVMGEVEPCG